MERSKWFTDRISGLLQGGEQWSDLTIEGDENAIFNVHRVIVCSQSKVLDETVRHRLRQNPQSVGKTRISLDIHPESLRDLVRYFHTGDYLDQQTYRIDPEIETGLSGRENSSTILPTDECTVWFHLDLYRTAHKYEIHDLKELSRNRLLDWMSVNQGSSTYRDIVDELFELPPNDSHMERVLTEIFWEKIASYVDSPDGDYELMKCSSFLRKVMGKLASDKEKLEKQLREANEEIKRLQS